MPKGVCNGCGDPTKSKYDYCTNNRSCSLQRRKSSYRMTEHSRLMVDNARERARKFGVDFDLDQDDIVIPQYCPILGIKLERGTNGRSLDSSPSLDRIFPEKGYVKGNVQVISQLANQMKNSATPQQLLDFADWIYDTFGGERDS